MTSAQAAGLLRHLLSIIGTLLVAYGGLDPDTMASAVDALCLLGGAGLNLLAIWHSLRSKRPGAG